MKLLLLLLVCALTQETLCAAEIPTKGDHNRREISALQQAVSSILARLDDVEKQNMQLLNLVDHQARENRRHAQEIDRQAQEIDRQAHEIDRLANENTHQKQAIERLESNNNRQRTKSMSLNQTQTPEPDTRSQYTAFACNDALISLSCPNDRTLFVTSGNYAKYETCSNVCCAPNPEFDCTELIEENSPQDWTVIKELCDGKEACEFENPGSAVDECQVGYLSDYMQLFYDCLPDDDTGPVAFTAWAETGAPTTYNSGDIIVFDQVLTNFGGHYNPATSSFICPVNGVYIISVSVQAYDSNNCMADLMRDAVFLTRAWADDVSGGYTRGTSTIVTECSRGEALWVKAGEAGNMDANNRHCVFTGHLLQEL